MQAPVILDFDGVLAPTEQIFSSRYSGMMQRLLDPEYTMTPEAFDALRTRLHRSHPGTIYGWAAENGHGPEWVIEKVRQANMIMLETLLPQLRPNPEMLAALEDLRRRGHSLIIFTSAHRDYTHTLCRHLNISEIIPPERVFDTCFTNGATKHIPETYHLLFNHLNLKPEEPKIMVEDSIGNLVGAKKAGCETHYILSTHPEPPNPKPAEIDHIFPNIVASLRHIAELTA